MTLTDTQRRVLTVGLPTAGPFGEDADLVAMLGWAAEHRLTGLLWQAAFEHGDVPDLIDDAYQDALRRALMIEATAVRAICALDAAGIGSILWKGIATAHADYNDPGNRSFYDADLLVTRVEFGAAIETLSAAGFRRVEPPLGRQWESRFGRAAVLVDPEGVEVDLHATIAAGSFGVRFDHAALFQRAETMSIAGHPARRPCADDRFITTAYALVLSRGGSLRLVRDLAQLIHVTGVDPRVPSQGDQGATVATAAAIIEAAAAIDLPHDIVAWAHDQQVPPRQRRALRRARDAHGWKTDAASELSALGWVDRITYVAAMRPRRPASSPRTRVR